MDTQQAYSKFDIAVKAGSYSMAREQLPWINASLRTPEGYKKFSSALSSCARRGDVAGVKMLLGLSAHERAAQEYKDSLATALAEASTAGQTASVDCLLGFKAEPQPALAAVFKMAVNAAAPPYCKTENYPAIVKKLAGAGADVIALSRDWEKAIAAKKREAEFQHERLFVLRYQAFSK